MALSPGAMVAGAGLQAAGDLFSTIYLVENQKAMAAKQRELTRELNQKWMDTTKDMQIEALNSSYNTLRGAGFTSADAALLANKGGAGAALTWTPGGFKNYAPGAQLNGRYTAPTTSTYAQLAQGSYGLTKKAISKLQQIPSSRPWYYRLV
uniref:Putative basic protein n=1 Tax=Calicivirus pig/25A/ITA/2009 TaxID=709537 RepID=D9HP40_9CALI|nr:putative basic protein [Calicivirus pig/25A/ITA/2009]